MSDELNALRNQLTTWFMSLDERTQGFFEATYAAEGEAGEAGFRSSLYASYGQDVPQVKGPYGPLT